MEPEILKATTTPAPAPTNLATPGRGHRTAHVLPPGDAVGNLASMLSGSATIESVRPKKIPLPLPTNAFPPRREDATVRTKPFNGAIVLGKN